MTRLAAMLLMTAAFVQAEEVNTPAPELEMKLEDGQVLKLSQLKGKPVLIEFFSTTCPHCQKSAAAIEKIVRSYSPKGLQVIAVTNDESQRREFADFRQKYGATYRMATVNREDAYRFFNLSVMRPFYVPSFAFIDRTGLLREKIIGGLQVEGTAAEVAELTKHIEPLFKTAPAKSAVPARPAPTQAKR